MPIVSSSARIVYAVIGKFLKKLFKLPNEFDCGLGGIPFGYTFSNKLEKLCHSWSVGKLSCGYNYLIIIEKCSRSDWLGNKVFLAIISANVQPTDQTSIVSL